MKKRVLATVLTCAMAFHFLSPLEQAGTAESASDHSITGSQGTAPRHTMAQRAKVQLPFPPTLGMTLPPYLWQSNLHSPKSCPFLATL